MLKLSFDTHYLSFAKFESDDQLASYPVTESQRVEIDYSSTGKLRMIVEKLPLKYENLVADSKSPANNIPMITKYVYDSDKIKFYNKKGELVHTEKNIVESDWSLFESVLKTIKENGHEKFDYKSILVPGVETLGTPNTRNYEFKPITTHISGDLYRLTLQNEGQFEGITYAYSSHIMNLDTEEVYSSKIFDDRGVEKLNIQYFYDNEGEVTNINKTYPTTNPNNIPVIMYESIEIENLNMNYNNL